MTQIPKGRLEDHQSESDRRGLPRHPVHGVLCRTHYNQTNRQTHRQELMGEVLDISLDGAKLALQGTFSVGDMIEVEFSRRGYGDPMILGAVIRWVVPSSDPTGKVYHGCRFHQALALAQLVQLLK